MSVEHGRQRGPEIPTHSADGSEATHTLQNDKAVCQYNKDTKLQSATVEVCTMLPRQPHRLVKGGPNCMLSLEFRFPNW